MFILVGAVAIIWLMIQGFIVMFNILGFLIAAFFFSDDS